MVDQSEHIQEQIEEEVKDEREPVAVALNYDIEQPEKAPMVTALGKGKIAQEIIRLAEENSIPLYEDAQLVKLLSKLELDTEVPPELYVLVAEVLAFVYRLDRMARKRESVEERIEEHERKKAL